MSRGFSDRGGKRSERGGSRYSKSGPSRSQQSRQPNRPPKANHTPALVRGENAWNPGKKQDISENEKVLKTAKGFLILTRSS